MMTNSNKYIAGWLTIMCATIFTMIVVGGITRLTDSGLSMVDWRPIMGVLPPLNAAEWQSAFNAYQQYPEYKLENLHMDLAGFKTIFYWEYGHRVLGRFIGILYFIPLLTFFLLGRIDKPLLPKLLFGLALGGMQGLMGWYMVKSGLIDMPRVSHYRLAAHLMLAMSILAYLFWLTLGLLKIERISGVKRGLKAVVYAFAVCLVVQLTWGAFTAGSDAGVGYNTYPKMNEQWVADAVFAMQPLWLNLFENTAAMQFVHRWVGAALLLLGVVGWVMAMTGQSRRVKLAASATLAATLVQFGIGVLTLIHVIPLGLASLHQAWACVVLLSTVYLIYVVQHPRKTVDQLAVAKQAVAGS
jgi:cytochrome c oxidase assembly protein subunit 15